ncbi:MAG: DotU family type IV/VI secretion system protein [Acidobacteria bacterium]|jgi:type VI secretion system protein ImpK|nr:MAG: DotU family type IV/VI secretion system protein [Acidobacteriota bacterium]
MSSTQVTPLGSYRGSSPALDRRGWNLALGFQEVFTAVVRLRYNRQAVSDAETFRAQMRQALRVAEQEARSRGCSAEDVKQVIFAVVAFLDESVLTSRNPVFVNWPRLPLQAELFGHQLAGEIFFQELQKQLNRSDSQETADLLEIYYLCLLLGFKGRYAAGGDLRSVMAATQEKIRRIRGPLGALSPRGTIPADAVRTSQTDRVSRLLGRMALITAAVVVVLFILYKFVLMSGASSLSALAAGLLK